MLPLLLWPVLVLCAAGLTPAWAAEPAAFRAPPGFDVTLFAGDDLATNITAMTIDPQGRVVVAGPGYIKTLHDDDGDGRAERESLVSEIPSRGAQGLEFDADHTGTRLLVTGAGGVVLLYPYAGLGLYGPRPVVLLPLNVSEYGPHGIARGPDGDFYISCGNDAGIDKLSSRIGRRSPVKTPQAGAVLHLSLRTNAGDGLPLLEVVADGFRNPYDLDFTADGMLLTTDGDNEADRGLPWYMPSRLLDAGEGNRFGWLPGARDHGWNRPSYFFDNTAPAAEFGRGAPTGFVVYRHRQFPEPYRGGAFSADWLLGRVDYLKLRPQGSSCAATKEPFLQTVGNSGLTPVDLAVGPEGDLFVACGGRGTRGGVYRVRYTAGVTEAPPADEPLLPLRNVLWADQPLTAWSRARWVPQAQTLGKEEFFKTLTDPAADVADQVRAAEIVVELFGRIPSSVARKAIDLKRPALSARVAWGLSCLPFDFAWRDILVELTHDPDPRVQRAAWETLHYHPENVNGSFRLMPNWAALDDPKLDVRVRRLMETALVTAAEPLPFINRIVEPSVLIQRRAYDRHRQARMLDDWLTVLRTRQDAATRLRALRSVQLFFGDVSGPKAALELYGGYRSEWSFAPEGNRDHYTIKAVEILNELSVAFPTGNVIVDRELARTFVMFKQTWPEQLPKFAAKWTDTSDPVEDIHYLIVSSLVEGVVSAEHTRQTAHALLALDAKFKARGVQVERNWPLRIGELFDLLKLRDPLLPHVLVHATTFGRPEHALFVGRLPANLRQPAAEKIFSSILRKSEEEIVWNRELVEIVGMSRDPRAVELLRRLWKDPTLHDAIFPVLVRADSADDRSRFVDCLTSADPEVVARAAFIFRRLAPDKADERELAAAVRGLRQMCTIAEARKAREELLTLVYFWGGQSFVIEEPTAEEQRVTATALRDAYQPVFLRFALNHYLAAATAASPGAVDPIVWKARLLKVDWSGGDADRGRLVFKRKQCNRCHEGGSKLGPNLEGAAARYSRSELFATVFEPSRFVPGPYRPTNVETADGQTYTGIPIHESADAMLLQTGADNVVRIAGRDVAARRTTTQSIMPLGLLDDLASRDFADLYAYLKTLRKL